MTIRLWIYKAHTTACLHTRDMSVYVESFLKINIILRRSCVEMSINFEVRLALLIGKWLNNLEIDILCMFVIYLSYSTSGELFTFFTVSTLRRFFCLIYYIHIHQGSFTWLGQLYNDCPPPKKKTTKNKQTNKQTNKQRPIFHATCSIPRTQDIQCWKMTAVLNLCICLT